MTTDPAARLAALTHQLGNATVYGRLDALRAYLDPPAGRTWILRIDVKETR